MVSDMSQKCDNYPLLKNHVRVISAVFTKFSTSALGDFAEGAVVPVGCGCLVVVWVP